MAEKLNKPWRTPGGPKKSAVRVRDPKTGNIKLVRFGDPNMTIKRDQPGRKKSFRARHGCDTDPKKKDKTTPGYWSCKAWESTMGHRMPPSFMLFEQDELTVDEIRELLKLSDEELEAEGVSRAELEDMLAELQAAPPSQDQAPSPQIPPDDEAPEPDDPVVLQVHVVEVGPGEEDDTVVKTFEFAGKDEDAALQELKVAARRNDLLRHAMNELPYKGRTFKLIQQFLAQDPDAPEESTVWAAVARRDILEAAKTDLDVWAREAFKQFRDEPPEERAMAVAITVGRQAKRLGWGERELSKWLQGAYSHIWAREGHLNPGLDMKDVRKYALLGYRREG